MSDEMTKACAVCRAPDACRVTVNLYGSEWGNTIAAERRLCRECYVALEWAIVRELTPADDEEESDES